MKGGTLYIRVIEQDRKGGYWVLASWEKPVVQRTCAAMSTLGHATQADLDRTIATLKNNLNAGSVVDLTADGLKKRFAKMFEEQAAELAKTVDPELSK
jgi:DnaJ-domain-containing protein 1